MTASAASAPARDPETPEEWRAWASERVAIWINLRSRFEQRVAEAAALAFATVATIACLSPPAAGVLVFAGYFGLGLAAATAAGAEVVTCDEQLPWLRDLAGEA